jgi:F-type H+-transporting ATPase subunit O
VLQLLLFFFQPLPPDEEKELKETLQDVIGRGKKVKLEQKVRGHIIHDVCVIFMH